MKFIKIKYFEPKNTEYFWQMKLNTFLVFRLLAHIYFEVDLKIHFEEAEDMVSDQAPWFITVFSKLFFSWVCQHERPVTLKLDRFYSWEYLLFWSPALDWKILLKIVTARHIILLFLFCLPFFGHRYRWSLILLYEGNDLAISVISDLNFISKHSTVNSLVIILTENWGKFIYFLFCPYLCCI